MMRLMRRFLLLALGLMLIACVSPTVEVDLEISDVSSSESQLEYVGLTQDTVPEDYDGDPDGKPDHEFRFTHTFANEVTLKDMTLSRVESGSANGIAGWTTTNSILKYWILKVQLTGSNVNGNARVNNIDTKLSGQVTLNLFGSDARGYKLSAPGTAYELVMRFTDVSNTEKKLTKRLTL